MEVNNSSQPWNTSAVYDSRSRCVHLPYPMRYLPFTFTEPLIGSALFLAAHCRSSKLHSAPVHVSLNSSETLIGDRCRDWLMRFPYNMYMQHTLQSLFEGLSKEHESSSESGPHLHAGIAKKHESVSIPLNAGWA